MSVLKELNIQLTKQVEQDNSVSENMVNNALAEIQRDSTMPLEDRGGETLENVNDLFNLMAMRLKDNAAFRKQSAENFSCETRLSKSRPNVIYLKNPRDRLLMMTEQMD